MIEEKIRWVPLKFDLMAKKIFGNNDNQNQIKLLLNQILGITPSYVEVLNNEIIDKPYKDKKFEVDLLVKTIDGVYIGVEINTDVSKKITNRNLFYMCRIMSRDLKRSESFTNLHKHIQISFDFKGSQELPIMTYKLLNKETGKVLSELMEIIKINVPYFYDRCYNEDATKKERFIGLFNEENAEKAKELIKGDKDMEELYDKIIEDSDDEIIGLYDIESHRREVEKSLREEATTKSYNEGIEQGLKQGTEKGLKQGIKQGTENTIKNTIIAMLKKGMDINIISEITEKDTNYIEKIKENL